MTHAFRSLRATLRPAVSCLAVSCLAISSLVAPVLLAGPARAAERDGVVVADTIAFEGSTLPLNGLTLRTYSILSVPIYVAGLYLPARTHDAESVIASDQPKVLEFHFLHDVDAEAARKAWQEGFDDNCAKPCNVRPEMIRTFLAGVTPIQKGDVSRLVFKGPHVAIFVNNRQVGVVDDRNFSVLLLQSFIGLHPPAERIKRELMGER